MSRNAITCRLVSVACGILFSFVFMASVVSAQTIEVLHSFSGCVPTGCLDGDGGEHPTSTLVQGPDGSFYGTTYGGPVGADSKGTIFRIGSDGAMTTLFTFLQSIGGQVCPNGCFPIGTLALGTDGGIYGVTESGGLFGDGTLFKITLAGHFTKLHDFDDGSPSNHGLGGGLALGPDGKFYGTTRYGGPTNFGTVFRLETDGSITTLFAFSGNDGQWPFGDLVRGSDGNVYGTTQGGGGGGGTTCGDVYNGCGTVFRVSVSGTVSMVHAFDGTAGVGPVSGLTQGTDGNFYGTNSEGGNGCGTAYRMTLSGTVTLIHAFAVGNGGCVPRAQLVQGANGDFFGTTAGDQGGHKGSVYQLTPTGAATALHNFLGPEGSHPFGGVVQASNGYLYGTTSEGGDYNLGVVFRVAFPAQNSTLDVVEDTPKDGTLIATYPNGTLTFSIVSNGVRGTATITDTETGAFTYTPEANANGSDSFTFKANNGTVDSNVATVTVTITPVNDAPVAADGTASTTFGTPVSGGLVATDVDSSSLTYAIVANGASGNAIVTNAATGAYLYTPNAGAGGSDTFTFKANDGASDSNVATITVTIEDNSAPVASAGTLSVTEDTAASGTLQATDPEGHALTFSIVSNGIKGTVLITNPTTGAYTYTPKPNVNGADSFTFRVNDGTVDSNVATVTITVTPVNDAPTAQAANLTTNEDTAASATLAASDVEGDTLAFSITSNGTKGTAVITNAATGAYTYTPNLNANGADSFTFKVNDGVVDSNLATVSITITPINDPPIAVNDSFSTNEDTTLTVVAPGLLVNDTNVDGDNLSALQVTGPAHGTLTLNPNGSFTYTPAANYNGQDAFTYRTSNGTAQSNIATVMVTVNAINDAPVAFNGSLTTNEGTATNGNLTATDVDGPALTFTVVSNGTKGAATITNPTTGAFTYTPAANAIGPDAFTFKANDGTRDSNVATVSVTITVVNNRAPVASNDAYTTNLNTVLIVPLRGVLTNDTDVNGDPLTALQVTGPAHGTLTLSPNGSFTYTPAANYFGPDSFTYRANDGTANSNVATVAITVTAPIVTVNPASLTFGTQPVGTTSSAQVITVLNTGNGQLTITGISTIGINAADFARSSNCGASLAPGASCRISVTFTPTNPGSRNATIEIRNNALGSPHRIGLTGTGTIVSYTGSLNLGMVSLDSDTRRATWIRNPAPVQSGSPIIRISDVVITTQDATDFSIYTPDPLGGAGARQCRAGVSLRPQEACEIVVQFKPTKLGPRRGDLVITFLTGERTRTIQLNGIGLTPTP
jgi:uncharacterized repeat protein (TIGR03803 family)/VCBS repeat-containing protein